MKMMFALLVSMTVALFTKGASGVGRILDGGGVQDWVR